MSYNETAAFAAAEFIDYDAAWRDAYGIAWVGASNPRGVQHTIDKHIAAGVDADHPAIQAMQGHLDYLEGRSLGPSSRVLQLVEDHHANLTVDALEGT